MLEKISMQIRDAISALAGPRGVVDSRARWFERAARKANVSPRSIKSAFYGEITDPEHKVIRRILSAAEARNKAAAHEIAATYRVAAERLRAADPDFHQHDIAALVAAARIICGENPTE